MHNVLTSVEFPWLSTSWAFFSLDVPCSRTNKLQSVSAHIFTWDFCPDVWRVQRALNCGLSKIHLPPPFERSLLVPQNTLSCLLRLPITSLAISSNCDLRDPRTIPSETHADIPYFFNQAPIPMSSTGDSHDIARRRTVDGPSLNWHFSHKLSATKLYCGLTPL